MATQFDPPACGCPHELQAPAEDPPQPLKYLPIVHVWHSENIDAPFTEAKVPYGHETHEVDSIFAGKVPAVHDPHEDAPASDENEPRKHAVAWYKPPWQNEPTGQRVMRSDGIGQ